MLILQDGQRTGDLSSQSSDHGVSVNPAAAQRIEVVRGPATLLYGANAIGGLVNVITDEIPTAPQRGDQGHGDCSTRPAPRAEAGTAADVHVGNGTLALHAGGGGRRSATWTRREGEVANSQSRSAFGNVGLAWTGEKGFFGGSYGYDDMKYGVPVIEDGHAAADAAPACADAARRRPIGWTRRSSRSASRWRTGTTGTTSWRAGKWAPRSTTTPPSCS